MPDYSQGKIYKIVCDTTGEVYYGATTYKYLSSRLAKHKNRTTCKSKQILDRGNYSIVLVEEYPCDNKEQLNRRERYYIENNDCINKIIPTRTQKEWYEANKDKVKKCRKEWYENNKDYMKEYQKQYRNTEKGKKIRRIISWKNLGIIFFDYDLLHEIFIETTHCDLCGVKLTEDKNNTKTTRCLDHDHSITDYDNVRNILCWNCNIRLTE